MGGIAIRRGPLGFFVAADFVGDIFVVGSFGLNTRLTRSGAADTARPLQYAGKAARSLLLLLVASLGAGATVFSGALTHYARVARGPRLEIPQTRIDLGDGPPLAVMRGILHLKNVGRGPLDFTTKTSCGCQQVVPRDGTILPGEEVSLSVALKLGSYSNVEKTERITIESNDRSNPIVTCLVTAKAPAPFDVSPSSIDFGSIHAQDAAECQGVLHVRRARTREQPKGLHVVVAAGKFQAALDAHGAITVTPGDSLAPGDHYDTLDVMADDSPGHVVRVPIHLRVVTLLSIVPSTVALRRDTELNLVCAEFIAVKAANEAALGELRAVDGPAVLRIEEIAKIDERRRRYRVSVNDGALNGEGRFSLQLCEFPAGNHCDVTCVVPDR